jgi:DegV family protein with EDD domain
VSIRVVTDSACDLPDDLATEFGIEVVPLSIRFGSEELVDREELSAPDFCRRLRETDVLPETSAPSAGRFETAFRKVAAEGASAIVCINISSQLSATMQAAQLAASAVADTVPVEVVDSMSVSMGLGNLCVSAATMGREGAGIDDIVADTISRRDRTRLYGVLDTLEFLKKGGRVGNARALLGSMLSIKPILEVRDGVVKEGGKVRTRSRALQFLVERVKEGPVENLAVVAGACTDTDKLLDALDPIVSRDRIRLGEIGPVIGTHGGPGVIGVAFQVPS